MVNVTDSPESTQLSSDCITGGKRLEKRRFDSKNPTPASSYEAPSNCSKNVRFSTVVVYSFAREQGFSSVPDTGWCSLGMSRDHHSVSRYDIHHHQLLQRLRRRRRRLLQKPRITSSSTSLAARIRGKCRNSVKGGVTRKESPRLSPGDSCRVPAFPSPPPLSPQSFFDRTAFGDPPNSAFVPSDVQATPPPPCLSPPSPRRVLAHYDDSLVVSNSFIFPEGFDTDSEASLDQVPSVKRSETVKSSKPRGKLMPIHGAARIRILKEAGVSRLDESERDVCLQIRATRSCVGCNCGPRYPCLPGRCACAEEGIQCQVDRASFPCSCSAAQCHNPHGRTEFSQEQVRAYVHQVISRFSKQTEDSLDGHSPRRPSLVPQPSGDSEPQFALPNPVGACRRVSTEVQGSSCSKSVTHPTPPTSRVDSDDVHVNPTSPTDTEVKSDPFRTAASVPCHAPSGQQYAVPVTCQPHSLNWISSTPAPQETLACRSVVIDMNASDQLRLDPSVSVARLKSPETSALCNSPPGMDCEVINLISPEPKSSDESPQTTPLKACAQQSPDLGRIKRNCRTPMPRKRAPQTLHGENPLLSISLNAVPDSRTQAVLRMDNNDSELLRITGNVMRLPDSSSEWFAEVTDSPLTRATTGLEHPSARLTWDTVQETTQVLSHNPPANPNNMDNPFLRGVLSGSSGSALYSRITEQPVKDAALGNTSCVSTPRTSTTKPVSRWQIPNYASYRMKAVQFASKSAPNSPCSAASPSLGRLSLRHRAIPRLPVTPSRRIPRSPRPPNFRFARKSQNSTASPQNPSNDSERTPNRELLNSPKPKQPRTPGKTRPVPPESACATVSQESSVVSIPAPFPSVSSSS